MVRRSVVEPILGLKHTRGSSTFSILGAGLARHTAGLAALTEPSI